GVPPVAKHSETGSRNPGVPPETKHSETGSRNPGVPPVANHSETGSRNPGVPPETNHSETGSRNPGVPPETNHSETGSRNPGVPRVTEQKVHRRDGGSTFGRSEFGRGAFRVPAFEQIEKKHGDRLPHWTAEGAVYHVTFRLADSLPNRVLKEFEQERDALLKKKDLTESEKKNLNRLVSRRIEEYLDRGIGACLMKQPGVADIVANALAHFDGERYHLHAWCVMPNHVHLVIQPCQGHKLPNIIHSLKSYTAHEINKALRRKGRVWMAEYFDHLIRSEASYERMIKYVIENPSKAGLRDWRWVNSHANQKAPPLRHNPHRKRR
ncbi:MAG: transposase, partial [Armatimonadota bacterium]